MTTGVLAAASAQDGSYPRPQLIRERWASLDGDWQFAFDDDNVGLTERWFESPDFAATITVPYPPESPKSGINDTAPHRYLWYSRTFGAHELEAVAHSPGRRLLLNFGAVDYRCTVWVDGQAVGSHEGGHTPFSFDITDALGSGDEHTITLRVEDDPSDVTQPRGKQDWLDDPHVIWYHRTSGIWQPVWLESVAPISINTLHWSTNQHEATVTARIELNTTPRTSVPVKVEVSYDGVQLGAVSTLATTRESIVVVPLPQLVNAQAFEDFLWSPEHPRLIDAVVSAGDDEVASYFGIRSARTADGWFLLNDRPYYVRSVLSQGYWPDSHLAAPDADALRAEVQLIKDMGFNAARVHQKFEDPRMLFWADKLGLLIWGEAAGTFAYTPTAVERTTREWLEVVRRDYSHPSIVTWVPLNESWGVQHIAHDKRMQQFAQSVVSLTRALDATRPVVSNDGWEQVDTDIIAIHDYSADPALLEARYVDRDEIEQKLRGIGPAGRPLVLSGEIDNTPIMLTEFGGISYDTDSIENAWGYSTATSPTDFAERVGGIVAAVRSSRALAGFCYTQLTDTLQETNGLADAHRQPKLPIETIRAIITGEGD